VAQDLQRALEAKTRECKGLSEELASTLTQMKILERIVHLFGAPDDLGTVLEGLMDAAMACVDAESGALYLLDSEKNELYFAAARGPKAAEVLALDIRIKPGQGMAGNCFLNREVIAVSEVHKDPRFFKEVSDAVGYQVRTLLTAPIMDNAEPYGAIQVINKRGSNEFTHSDVEMFRRLGRYAGSLVGLGIELQELRRAAGVS
jgi:GAF domain-containing protein